MVTQSDTSEPGNGANVGDLAPDFSLSGAGGVVTTLSDFRGTKRALLIFYPKDQTAGCTDQLAAVRETLGEFKALDTEPFGVNHGSAASHQLFIDELELPFDLLVDEGLAVAASYGALKPDGSGIQRTVVIVGKDGKIIYREPGAPPPIDLLEVIAEADDN